MFKHVRLATSITSHTCMYMNITKPYPPPKQDPYYDKILSFCFETDF